MPNHHTVLTRFEQRVRTHPDRIAVVDGDQRISYLGLAREAARVGAVLDDAGVAPGGLLGLRMARSWRTIAAVLGIWSRGRGYVPVDPDAPEARRAQILAQAGLRHVVVETPEGYAVDSRSTVDDAATVPDGTAYVIFTSGSSGAPKGVIVSHRNVCALVDAAGATGVHEDGTWSQAHTHNFDFSVWEMWVPLLAGGTCVVVPGDIVADPERFVDLLRRDKVTVLNIVPSVFRGVAAFAAGRGLTLPDLRDVVFGGEAIDVASLRQWWSAGVADRAVLHNMYGITECTVHVTTHTLTPQSIADATPGTPIGIALPHLRVMLMADGQPVPDGEIGEIHVSGDGVADGYLNRPDLTEQRFVRVEENGFARTWYRSGDLARLLPDGSFVYLGRSDDQVKIRGIRVEPGETESALRSHPDVDRAVVVAVSAVDGALELAAAITPSDVDGPRPDESALRDHLLARLPAAFVPVTLKWFDRLPVTESGKIDRARLSAELASARPARATVYADGLDRLWQEAVGEWQDADAGFLSLGGHSLTAARLVSILADQFGVRLPLRKLLQDNMSLNDLRGEVGHLRERPRAIVTATSGPTRWRLTSTQRRMWVQDRIDPDPAAYNVVAALLCPSAADVDGIVSALTDTADRHAALCARIELDADNTPLWVRDDRPLSVRRRTVEHDVDDEAVAEQARAIGAQTIDLVGERPLRLGIVHRPGTSGVGIVLSLHHIVADLRSVEVFFDDFARVHRARSTGVQPDPPPAVPDVQTELRVPSSEKLEHWVRMLADAPDGIALPFRAGDGTSAGHRGHVSRTSLGAEVSASIDRTAAGVPSTAFMVMFAALCVVLARWSGQRTLVFGVPASHRGSADDHDLVGFMLDTLAVRLDPGDDMSVVDLVRHVRDRFVEALEHHEVPFDDVVAALGRRTTAGRTPVFNVWLNDLTRAAAPPAIAGDRARYVDPVRPVALFELNLYVRRDDHGYLTEFVGSAAGLPAELLDELGRQFAHVLGEMTAAPDATVSDLTLASARPAGRLESVAHADTEIADMIQDLLAEATSRGAAIAIEAAGRRLSYGELADEVSAFGARLQRAGIGPGAAVELLVRREVGFPVALLALWSIGAVPCLVDAEWPDKQLSAASGIVNASHVVGTDLHVEPTGRVVRLLPGTGHVLFTSGTASEPAAVLVPATALPAAMTWYLGRFRPASTDRVPVFSGVAHDPVLRDILVPLLRGGTCVLPGGEVLRSPARMVDFLDDNRVTTLHATPPLLRLLVAALADHDRRLDALRLVISGGAPLLAGTVRALRERTAATVVNAYGMTESPQIAACAEAPNPLPVDDFAQLTIGSGVNGTALTVLDGRGRPTAVGERGEVVLVGRNLAAGYLPGSGRPGVFTTDGSGHVCSLRTGDLGRTDPHGSVHLDGRSDRQVQIRGFRLELSAVEEAALGDPDVVQALAAALPDGEHDRLALQVVPAAGAALRADEVRDRLRQLLPAYAVPSVVDIVDRIRLNGNNKVVWDERPPAAAEAGDDDVTEAILGSIEQTLGRRIGLDVNFFDAGLTSMGLLRLQAWLADRLDQPVSVTGMFDHTTVRALSRYLSADPALAQQRRSSAVDRVALAAAGRARRDIRRRIIAAQRTAEETE